MNRIKQSLASLPSFTSGNGERPTTAPLDLERLESLSTRRQTLVNLHSTFASYHKTIAKERPDPTNDTALGTVGIGKGETKLPTSWVGEYMVQAAQQLEGERTEADEKYKTSLALVGEAHVELGNISALFHQALGDGYLQSLERRLEEFKDLDKLMKEAEKKRTALETMMAKIEKGKKEKSEYEHDLDQAEWAYGDACDSLTRKADQIEAGVGNDVEALKDLVDAQLEFASNYTSMLQSLRNQLPSPVSYTSASASRSSATSPARSRSSTLQLPAASTRMSRSLSDSSATGVPSGLNLGNSLLSSLGPGRTRRSTVSSQTDEKDKEKDTKNRSRSGSVLERFALGAGKKDKKKKDKESKGEGGEVESPPNEEADLEATESRSRSNSNTSNPSLFGTTGIGMPSLPTMGSFKKLASPSSSKYGTLADSDVVPPSALDFSASPSSSPNPNGARRMIPPALKRTQTAPPTSNPSSPTPSSPRPRVMSPLRPSFHSPVGRTVLARWAYHPSLADPDELEFDKGDSIRVEKEINSDWWIGKIIEGRHEGSKGMFPSAYVVVQDDESDKDRYGEGSDREGENGRTNDQWTSSRSDNASLRSSTRTESTEDDDTEEEELRLTSTTPRSFSPGRFNGSPKTRLPPPLPHPSSNSATKRQPPPPPPTRRTNSGSGLLNNKINGNDEGRSPFE